MSKRREHFHITLINPIRADVQAAVRKLTQGLPPGSLKGTRFNVRAIGDCADCVDGDIWN
jgi:hypothetical protein